jgi:protein arginine kinase
MVLRSLPTPAWLSLEAHEGDVVLSTRARALRNLRGYRFPHVASTAELEQILDRVLLAAGSRFDVMKQETWAERAYMLGCRMISPEFQWSEPGRALLLSKDRTSGVMVNEEDHLRLQSLLPGWAFDGADKMLQRSLAIMGQRLEFAQSEAFGYLAASPYNTGQGIRLSAMCHLIGLANAKRLVPAMRALSGQGIVVRGLFGESSRAIGAFVQVSITRYSPSEFVGAMDYLIREERVARASLPLSQVEKKVHQARDFAIGSRSIALSDALRVLAWVRLGSSLGLAEMPLSPRTVDSWLTTMELRSPMDEQRAAADRANWLRTVLER